MMQSMLALGDFALFCHYISCRINCASHSKSDVLRLSVMPSDAQTKTATGICLAGVRLSTEDHFRHAAVFVTFV